MNEMFLHHLDLKKVVTFLILMFTFAVPMDIGAQTPQYYNTNAGTGINTYPWGQPAGQRVQWLIRTGTMINPTPCPGGIITKLYFYMGNTATATFTDFTIKMANLSITTLPASFDTTGFSLVYYKASVSHSSTNLSWMVITLDSPFPYDTSKALVIDARQCGYSGTGLYVRQSSGTPATRNYGSPGPCPQNYTGQDGQIINFGVDVVPAILYDVPDLIYYKFENNPAPLLTPNYAVPGVGTNPAPILAPTPLASGGQFDTCISGTGVASGGVNTGWLTNLGTGSWTISMWVTIPSTSSGSAFYIFGESVGTFRCFHNGVALPDNMVLRGTGITDVNVTGIGPAPTVVHFVYDSAASQIRAYKNGVLATTISQTPLNLATGTGFRAGGYGSSITFYGKLDEFRVYRRALPLAEIQTTWYQELPVPVGIAGNNNQTPVWYSLSQNYPNPFNPSTKISYSIPKAGNVKLVVYDILGKGVATLVNEYESRGTRTVEFNASNLASGVYFYRIETGVFTDTKKMLLIK